MVVVTRDQIGSLGPKKKKVGGTEGTRTLSGIPDGGSIVILRFLSATNPDKEEEKAEVEGRK